MSGRIGWARITTTTGPAIEPLTLSEAKAHLRMDDEPDDLDALIVDLIKAAREQVEIETGQALISRTQTVTYPELGALELPTPPLSSVSSITYLDSSGISQTLATSVYVAVGTSPAHIELRYGQSWPATYDHPEAVTVTQVVGYGSARLSVPQRYRQAVLFHLQAHLEQDPKEMDNLMRAHKALCGVGFHRF